MIRPDAKRARRKTATVSIEVTGALLRRRNLPLPDRRGSKEDRGRVLIVGGAPELVGAVILASESALRAGAGKLQIATCSSIAIAVGTAIPEARVFALPETRKGGIAPSGYRLIAERADEAQAVLIGPGLVDDLAVKRLLAAVLPRLSGPTLVLDAGGLQGLGNDTKVLAPLGGKAVLTPHAGEMAKLLGLDAAQVTRDPRTRARDAAHEFGALVALKGAETFIASPDGTVYRSRAGNVGLATSGSGDVLAGVIAGLAARRSDPLTATLWGVYAHGTAGDRLAKRIAPIGFLARELMAEIPAILGALQSRVRS